MQTSIDFLDQSLIPFEYLPKVKLKTGLFQAIKNEGIAYDSDYQIQTTFYVQVILLIQIIVIFLGLLILFALIYMCSKLICRCSFIKNIKTKLLEFILIALPSRIFIENFFSIFITFILEFTHRITQRNLTNTSYNIFLSVSGVLLMIYFVALLSFAIILILKSKSTNSNFNTVTKGLNKNSWLYPFIYYLHYLGIWLFIGLMIFLTPFVDSFILWFMLSVFQGIFTLAHLVKLYVTISSYILVFVWEV